MLFYKPDYLRLLRFPFQGVQGIAQNYSQVYQDMFVLAVLDGKRNGRFLEVGCSDPVIYSNTLLLDKFGWNGVAIDRSADCIQKMGQYGRSCFLCLTNAVGFNYDSLLDSLDYPLRLDYLSLDIEPNVSTFSVLKTILGMTRRYSIVTFETEYYAGTQEGNDPGVRVESRQTMADHGYVLVAGNISAFGNDASPFEDWYLDSQAFTAEEIARFKRDSDEPIAAYKYIYDMDRSRL